MEERQQEDRINEAARRRWPEATKVIIEAVTPRPSFFLEHAGDELASLGYPFGQLSALTGTVALYPADEAPDDERLA